MSGKHQRNIFRSGHGLESINTIYESCWVLVWMDDCALISMQSKVGFEYGGHGVADYSTL